MRTYMEQLLQQIEDGEFMHGPVYDNAVKRLSGGELEAGARCAWCFAEDLEFWGRKIPHPKDWFYSGFIVPIPDHDGRGKLEPDKCIVCVLDYPIEKENPEVDWVGLLHLLTSPSLHRFHIMAKMGEARSAVVTNKETIVAVEPIRNRKGSLCGLCDGTSEHEHPRSKCLKCGLEGLSENIETHKCSGVVHH